MITQQAIKLRPAMLAGISVAALVLSLSCNEARAPHSANANAPALNEDAPLSSRGGTNPNAPFAVLDHTVHLQKRPQILDVSAAEPCRSTQLSLFESGAQMDGNHRIVRLNLVNRGNTACRLAGYPAISLLRQDGTLIGSIGIEKVTGTTIEARLKGQGNAPANAEDTSASAPSAIVMLAPAGEATFEVGWTNGENCDQVGSIAVAAPGTIESFTVHHSLRVCEGRILVTAVSDGTRL
jgi:hypothetical protein